MWAKETRETNLKQNCTGCRNTLEDRRTWSSKFRIFSPEFYIPSQTAFQTCSLKKPDRPRTVSRSTEGSCTRTRKESNTEAIGARKCGIQPMGKVNLGTMRSRETAVHSRVTEISLPGDGRSAGLWPCGQEVRALQTCGAGWEGSVTCTANKPTPCWVWCGDGNVSTANSVQKRAWRHGHYNASDDADLTTNQTKKWGDEKDEVKRQTPSPTEQEVVRWENNKQWLESGNRGTREARRLKGHRDGAEGQEGTEQGAGVFQPASTISRRTH